MALAMSFLSGMVLPLATTQRQKQRGEYEYSEVYVGSMRLRATQGPAQWALSTAYSMACWDLQHFIVLFKPPQDDGPCLLFDFQPKDPTNPFIALAALFGYGIPGNMDCTRKGVTKITDKKILVGRKGTKGCLHTKGTEFNQHWGTELKLGEHDCRHYTNALIEHVIGEHNVLRCLRNRIPN